MVLLHSSSKLKQVLLYHVKKETQIYKALQKEI